MTDAAVGLEEIMSRSVTDTIENMAFMEIIGTDKDASPPEGADLLAVSILIHDPFPGEMSLVAEKKLLTGIAGALYGTVDQENIDQTLFDVVAELLNTIAGRVMAELVSEDETFTLGLPELGAGSFSETNLSTVRCNFEAEGQYLSIMATGETLPTDAASREKNIVGEW